jgi:enoyl-CoA hydratase/carnithine racemase
MTEHVQITAEDGILRIVLTRPEKKNALTRAMYAAMGDGLDRATEDTGIRVVLITGSGDSYTSGNDLADFQSSEASQHTTSAASPFTDRIARFGKPIVAAVNGLAVGIGTTMLLHCDLVYAADTARFRLPFVDLGLVPELASSMLLPKLAGYHRAAELLLLGRFFSAEEAREIGLVNRVLPGAELLPYATETANALAAKPPQALAQTRALMRAGLDAMLAHKDAESVVFQERRNSPEAQAIFAAFAARARK